MNILSNVSSYGKALGNIGKSLAGMLGKPVYSCEPEVSVSVSKIEGSAVFTCGFAKRALIPEDEMSNYCIAGYSIGKRLRGIMDPCYARAVYIDDNSGLGGAVFIVLDVIGISFVDVCKIRERLSGFCKETGCRSINVMSTHNHETIDTLGPWGELTKLKSGRIEKYMQTVFTAATQAARAAYYSRRDGELYYGVTDTKPEAVLGGKYIVCQEDSRYPLETDGSLARFRFKPNDGSNEIFIVNYAAHAESLFSDNRLMSADFPGAMCDKIKRACGADTLFVNGAIGGLVMPGFFYYNEFDAQNVDASQLKKSAGRLGKAFVEDTENENCGFPVLKKADGVCETDGGEVLIYDEIQLRRFADIVSAGNTLSGVTVRLVNDIDLEASDFAGIGSCENRFCGCFDGGGHTLKGVKISGGDCTGLFSALGEGAKILNLTLRGKISGGKYTGGFAGLADGEDIELSGLKNYADVTGTERVGGIAGELSAGKAHRCENHGVIVSVNSYNGGIAGFAGSCEVFSCFNRGVIKSGDTVVGGICGEAQAARVYNCYNSAPVFARMCRSAGQITGRLTGEGEIKNCFGNSEESICPAVSLTRVGMGGPVSVYDQKEEYGAYLARIVCAMKDEKTEGGLDIAAVTDGFPIKNIALTAVALAGIIENKALLVKDGDSRELRVKSSVTYVRLGGVDILLVPGELFTELATGAYLDERHAASPHRKNPEPLNSIFGGRVRIFGLANDEIGYIMPPNDFFINKRLPYLSDGTDRNGKKHYEETNSLGPDTANKIAELARLAKNAMEGA